MNMSSKLVFACSFFAFATYFAFAATLLPENEVKALRDIAKTIGKTDWNFDADPCSEWNTTKPEDEGFTNGIVCNCSLSDAPACHVVAIVLKGQSLQGTVPPELVRLPYLQEIELTRNYLNGTLPREWGTMKLLKIGLNGNRVSGSIPKEFANITTLRELVLEYNQLTGSVPPELGDLTQIQRILLTSNNLSGELPPELAKLTTLTEFRIGDNNFTGNVPDYIKRWTNLAKLFIEGSGLNGPIPDIANLVKLVELRISGLNGPEQPFPPVYNLTNMKTMILRSCNIRDKLPEYLGNLSSKLRLIDLSFNKLHGGIPDTYSKLSNVDYTYLTGNLLNQTVPSWMANKGDNLDLSYNNFPVVSTENCQDKSVNLFANSLKGNNSRIVPCLASITCPKRLYYSLHINCGGSSVPIGKDTTYEADTDLAGPAKFFLSATNWAFSNTGNFLDDKRADQSYIWENTSTLANNIKDSQLYMTARLSPLSLTYYGFCLGNGNYTVQLHFAEIMFTDDKTYSSLGRRIFDVYIQGKRVLEDFNIAAAAGGVRKPIIKNFTTPVTNNTLEIRFYWAGKGTTGLPSTGVYGPLVSAISVEPYDFKPPPPEDVAGSSVGMIIGIVAAVLTLILLVLVIMWWKGCIGKKNTMTQDLMGLDLQTGSFTLRQIKAATNNFDPANKIGEGGFGSVYKGTLLDGTLIAVKQLSSKSKQGNREFVTEIGMISALEHPHLVKLYGCCTQGNQLLLVYEYLENNSLARALFGPVEHQLRLDWPTRHMICVGIARGLAYLHEESILKIVHRDIKATNVLLDKDLVPKISDFGLAKLDEEEDTHISTRIAGTYGYMAPEYAMRGYLTDKADVYSFGIVALEIVSGRSNTLHRSKEDSFNLLDWALILKEKGSLTELIDTRLGSDFNKEQVMEMINVALLCTDITSTARPAMSSVVSMLEGRTKVPALVSNNSSTSAEYEARKFMAMKKQYELSEDHSMSDGLLQSVSMCGPSTTTSSTSAQDLYPINLDSDYLAKRDQR